MMKALLASLLLVVDEGAFATSPVADRVRVQARAVDITHYDVTLEPDVQAGTVAGTVRITFTSMGDGADPLLLNAGGLTILSVTQAERALTFVKAGAHLLIDRAGLNPTAGAIDIRYTGQPKYGLEFQPERGEFYTVFSTSQWMVAIDAPSERATLDLKMILPEDFAAFAVGVEKSRRKLKSGLVQHRWRLKTPVPSFTYGFAAGKYQTATKAHGGTGLTYFSTDRDKAQLGKIFEDTGPMLDFFTQRTGMPYFAKNYVQGLVAKTVGQEMAGMSIMSEGYGLRLLDEPTRQGLMAHEIAHQWWGVMVTCDSWREFWLNEGFATFMAAVWQQHRFGDDNYAAQVQRWTDEVARLKLENADKPLVFPAWDKPTANDRAVVYQKGAYVLHVLRQELGEEIFWNGVKNYTHKNWGKSVTSADLQNAMEQSAGRSLDVFFSAWVSGKPVP
jgi:aminopeptidase N